MDSESFVRFDGDRRIERDLMENKDETFTRFIFSDKSFDRESYQGLLDVVVNGFFVKVIELEYPH